MSLCSDGLSSDQYFLVNFIMTNYLGPDVYFENPRCSASQRLAKGLPPYTSKHIGSSSLSVVQLQNLYYFVLRNAESSLLLNPDLIYMYLKGYLPLEPVGKFHQFTSFFPTNLHPHKRYSLSHEVVKGIVVIDDPALAFISKEELQRFRCLSRLNDLKIDRVVSLSPLSLQGTEKDCSRNREATSNGLVTNQDFNSSGEVREPSKGKKEDEAVATCVISKTPDRFSGDIPKSERMEQNSSRNKEKTSNGLVANHKYNSSGEVRETCKRKKEEEVVATCVISRTTESQGMEQECSRNKEEKSSGLVTNHEYNSSAEVRETCKRKRDEELVAGHAVCVISKTPERFSGDIPKSNGREQESSRNGEATSDGLVSDQDRKSSAEPRETCKRKKEEEEAVVGHAAGGISKTPEKFRETLTYKRKRFKNSSKKATNKNGETPMEKGKTGQPIGLALVPVHPEMKECDAVTTGTASKGTCGLSVGVIDIGVNKVAYFFQVSLPGVRRDYGEFRCEIESDGKVTLEGSTTTGGKTVERHSRVFKMNMRKMCPPGPFKLSFSLPGPVDPRLFSPNFRSDGIFEAVIMRNKEAN